MANIRSHIQDNWNCSIGMNSGTKRHEDTDTFSYTEFSEAQFGHWNSNPLSSLIPNSENWFSICDDNVIYIIGASPGGESFASFILILNAEETSLNR